MVVPQQQQQQQVQARHSYHHPSTTAATATATNSATITTTTPPTVSIVTAVQHQLFQKCQQCLGRQHQHHQRRVHNNNNCFHTNNKHVTSSNHHQQRSHFSSICIPICFGMILLCMSVLQLYLSSKTSIITQQQHQRHHRLPNNHFEFTDTNQNLNNNNIEFVHFDDNLGSSSASSHHHRHSSKTTTTTTSMIRQATITSDDDDNVARSPHDSTSDEVSTTITTTIVNDVSSHQLRQQQQQQPILEKRPRVVQLQHVWNEISYYRITETKHKAAPLIYPSISVPKQFPLGVNLTLSYTKNDTISSSSRTVDEMNSSTDAATAATAAALERFNHIKAMAMQQYMMECVPMVAWHTQSYPTCNSFHEMDMIGTTTTTTNSGYDRQRHVVENDDISLLSDQGSWRSVWKVRRQLWWKQKKNSFHNDTPTTATIGNSSSYEEETIVLKLLKLQRREFDEESYDHHRIDAMAMERLTGSTHIVNIYGHCGQSVLTEYASTSARSLTKDKSLSSLDRLKLGRDIVQAMTHLHSIDYSNSTNITMTHNDLNMANAVAVRQQIKLNDFNIGIVQRWNTTSNTMCKTPVMFEAPLWKSPEEIMASTAMKRAFDTMTIIVPNGTDTIPYSSSNSSSIFDTSQYWVESGPTDIFGLGNLLFQVLTKCQPWTHLEIDGPKSPTDAAQRKVRGEQPYMPPKYHSNTTTKVAYAALHYAVQLCYQTTPQFRPTSYELLNKLNTAIDWIEQRQSQIRPSALEDLFLSSSLSSS